MLKFKTLLRPIGKRVLVRPLQEEETSRGGILLLPGQGRKGTVGEVVGVGAKCKTKVAVGDVVIVTHFRGHEIELAGERYELLREEDVYGVIPEPKP